MAKSAEELQQENNDLLRQLVAKTGTAPGGGSGGGSGGGGAWASALASGANNAAQGLTKFTQGTYGASDALNNFKQVAGTLGPVGKVVGELTGTVGEAALGVNKSLNTVAQSGVYMGNNLGLYDKAVLQARMSLPEFENTIKTSGKSLAGLSFGMDRSALSYLATAKRMQETDMAYALKATGTDTEEFGKILTLVSHNARQSDLSRKSVQEQVIASSLKMATEMDNTARLTGISRQEQQESLERQLKSKESELAMLAMSEEERTAYQNNLSATKRYGDSVQDAIKIYSTGGPQNAEETQKIVALGPEMADAARRLTEVKGTSKEDDDKRAAIKAEMDNIVARKAGDKAYAEEQMRLYKSGDATAKAMATSSLEQIRYGQTIAKADEEAKKQGITREAFLKQEEDRVKATREANAKGTATGPEGAAALPAATINKTTVLLKDTMAGTGTLFNKLNTTMGETISGMSGLNKVLSMHKAENVAALPGKVVDVAKSAAGVKPVETKNIPASEKGRSEGSLGAVGKLIEDFGSGTPMMLHGREGVITEKQLGGLVSGLQSGLKSDIAKSKESVPTNATFEKMFSQIKMPEMPTAQMPSVPVASGGNSTTSELAEGIARLNKSMERLITAVEEGANNNVKAVKGKGNLIA